MTEKKLNPAPVKLDGWMIGRLDLFAAHALSGMLSDPDTIGTPEEFAKDAFSYARAMMRQSQITVADIEKRSKK